MNYQLKQKMINQSKRLSPVLAKCSQDFFVSQLRNPIFIIGCGRSGTTLLAELLEAHPDIANWSEANQIWDPKWYPWRPTNRGMWPMEFDPEAFTARWWQDSQPRQKQIEAIFGAYQWLWRKPYFLNKSPFNTFRIPYLLEMFQKPYLIHLVRDGRAVVYSYAYRLRKENKLQEWPEAEQTRFANCFDDLILWLASFWKANMEEVARQDAALGLTEAGILLEVTYEELCTDTSTVLDRICQHVGLDPTCFTAAVKQKPLKNQNHKWKENLEGDLINRMVAAMDPILTQWGYV